MCVPAATAQSDGGAAPCERLRVGAAPAWPVACPFRRLGGFMEVLVIRSMALCSLLLTACGVDLDADPDPDLDLDSSVEQSTGIDIAPQRRLVAGGTGLQLLE